MKKSIITLLCMSTLTLASPVIFADTDNNAGYPFKEVREKMKNMSPEEKRTMMENGKAKWNSLSDADKQAFRDKVKPMAEKRKAKLEKRCQELRDNNGEQIYIRMYTMDLMRQQKAGN